jgi:prevent-host-death family protein
MAAMITGGSLQAKTHLSSLLDRVAEGEEVLITKRGKPVAGLVSPARINRQRVRDAPRLRNTNSAPLKNR